MKVNVMKVAIVVSHPIQHFCPQYLSFSKNPDFEIKLFFGSMLGYRKYTDKNFGQEIVWNNLKVEEFDHIFLNGDQVLPSTKELDAPTLDLELQKFNPEVIISYGYFQKMQRRAHSWANKNNVPIAYITDAEHRQKRPLWKRLAKSLYLNWYFKKIDYFFTVGNANESYYESYGVSASKFIRMHYPIDIDTYEKAYNNKSSLSLKVREKYGIPNDEIVISVVGKLVEWKNQDHLIDMLIELERRSIKAHVIFLGSGAMLEDIRKKSSELKSNVAHFAGFVDPVELPEYYAASDIYVHPARIEPHSLAISEAIYMGCPVVISSTCGSYGKDDDVQEGKNGYVYEFGNIAQLTDKVELIINDSPLRKELGEYSRAISLKFQARSHKECLLDLRNAVRKY